MARDKPKILIIDDDENALKSCIRSLKREGYDGLHIAKNGKEGLLLFKKVSPVLVILDINMPVMDGVEFLEKIQIKPTDPYLVIALTAHTDDEIMKKCYDLGANFFLRKPCSRLEFCCIVRRAIELKQAEQQIMLETKKRLELERSLEEKQMEEKLMLADKMVAMGTMAAGVAHDVSSPLSVAIGYISLLKGDVNDLLNFHNNFSKISLIPDTVKEIEKLKEDMGMPNITENLNKKISRCEEAMERIKEIVHSLKDFSRLDKGDEIVDIDIVKEIETSIQMIPKKYKQEIEIKKELSPIPQIPCFGRQLGQVFLNIILNAFQAMKDEGVLKIETLSDNEHVYIKFCDNGPGIPENKFKKIFAPFYTTKTKGEGTGLGLSICSSIIEKHGGEITAVNNADKGCTFTIKLLKAGVKG